MKVGVAVLGAVLLVIASGTVRAEPPKGDLATLERKLVGTWNGQGGCDGKLTVRADGTFELADWSVGAVTFSGTWKVQWSELPPTLVLTCTKSEVKELVGTPVSVFLTELNDKSLRVGYPEPNGAPSGKYLRAQK